MPTTTSELKTLSEATTSPKGINAKDRLILALDFPNDPQSPHRMIEAEDAYRLIDQLGDLIRVTKVGWPLYMAGGREVIQQLRERGKKVFLDLKFGDISETVRRLVKVAITEGVEFITVNTSFQAISAAVEAAKGSSLKILTVTLLTSLDEQDLRQMGITSTVDDFVRYKTMEVAQKAGCHGIVASGREAAAIRKIVAKDFLIVTPGIRPPGASHHDHKRAVTPQMAIEGGADYLVVGRPITLARASRDATQAILDDMQKAFDRRYK